MCLYPVLIENKKYKPNKKNAGKPPKLVDQRLRYVTAACGICMECRKQYARSWQVRLYEENKNKKNGIFVTLTFNEDSINDIRNKLEDDKKNDDNEIATKAVRLFLERIRKKTGKSVRHWLVTEKGHEGTKRIHMHGIIWNDNAMELTKNHWNYGWIWFGKWVNEQTINYVVKYITKTDLINKNFKGKVLCSSGMGKDYINSMNAKNNKYKGEDTDTTYRTKSGTRINLPTYYKNKLLSENEREELWINKLDKGEVWVCGDKCNIDDEQEYFKLLNYHRERERIINRQSIENYEKEKYLKKLRKQREYYKNKAR